MSREIKFRFWDNQDKRWATDTFLYIDEDGIVWEIEERSWAMQSHMHRENVSDRYERVEYTGLRDTNGTEIYIGDIVDFTYWYMDGDVVDSHLIGEVIYIPEAMSYGLRGVKNADWIRHIGGENDSSDTAPFATWLFEEADFEVIGNIHENPELVKW